MDAVERAFGANIDYGQIVKFYDAEPIGPGRYAPPRVTGAARTVIAGSPDQAHISTSPVERQNLTMRMSMHRFTRLTNAFSKKFENLPGAVALHFAHYNLVRLHKTLRVTPAMAAKVTDRVWSLEELTGHQSEEWTMIWRNSTALKSGTVAFDATPYLTEAEALAAVKKDFDAGFITAADLEDHDHNRIGWLEIKRRWGLPDKSN